jgi:hypothetical protein
VFIPEKDIQDRILHKNPVPKDIQEAPKMDVVTLGVLEKKNKPYTIAKDSSLRRVDTKIREVYGPFARIWNALDGAIVQDRMRPVQLDLDQMLEWCEQTSIMLGQASNTVSYLRRKLLLSNITSDKVVKSLMSAHKDVFEEKDPFNEIIPYRVWDKVSDTNKEVERIVKAVRTDKQPFRRGSQSTAARSGGPSAQKNTLLNQGGYTNTKSFPPSSRGEYSRYATIINTGFIQEIPGYPPHAAGGATRKAGGVEASRTTTVICRPVENPDERPRDPADSYRMGDSAHQHTSSHKWQVIYPQRGRGIGAARDSEIAGQRSHTGDRGYTGSGVVKPVSARKEGWLPATHSESKELEPTRSVYPFQNGKPERGEKPTQAGRYHGEDRPEGRLLHCSVTSQLTEICKVSMEKPDISIPLPLFWTRPGTKIVHKVNEGAHVNPTKVRDKADYLSGRHPDIRVLTGGDRTSKGHHVVPAVKLGVCHQPREVRVDPIKDYGVLGGANKQHRSDNVTDRGKDLISDQTLQSGTEGPGHVLKGPQQTGGEVDFHISRNNTLHVASEASSTGTNPESTKWGILRIQSQTGLQVQVGTHMVGRKSQTESRETHNDGKPRPDNLLGCSNIGGWGAYCQGIGTGGQWTALEKERFGRNINMLELMAAELAIKTFWRRHQRAKNIHLMIDNKTALAYLVKMGGKKSVHLIEKTKQIWDFLLEKGIMITAEYLPTDLNVDADRESRNVMDWSEWKLHPWLFEQICLTYGTPEVDLFASRTSHQIHDTRSLFILYSGFLMFLLNGSRQYIQLSAWAVSGRREQTARFRRELDTCWSTRENWQPDVVTTQPGRNLVAGVVRGKLILFNVPFSTS